VPAVSRIVLIGITLLGCVGCDQVLKGAVRHYLAPGDSYSFLHDMFRLVHAENSGAFLSLGAALPEHTRTVIFTGIVGVLTVAAFLAALLARGLGRWQVFALALISAGGCGNWIDRLTNGGRVTDFLNVGIGPLRTGIFNAADLALMVGVSLFVLIARHPAASNNRWRRP
jgi:signal peptidase II